MLPLRQISRFDFTTKERKYPVMGFLYTEPKNKFEQSVISADEYYSELLRNDKIYGTTQGVERQIEGTLQTHTT